jgi:hypothetical protein
MSSSESKEQGRAGRRGAEAKGERGRGAQPRQQAGRVEQPAEAEPKHHFPPGRAPSEQGETEAPSPESIKKNQQGFAGGGSGKSGSREATAGRGEEQAQAGSPDEGHARHGRQGVPGDREPR